MYDYKVQKHEDKDRSRFSRDFGKYLIIEYFDERYDAKATALTESDKTFVIELKGVNRPFDKHGEDSGFLIDFDKCRVLVKTAKNENRIPLLVVYFSDCCMIWNLLDTGWEKKGRWVETNAVGVDYGKKKEWEYVTFLYEREGKKYGYN